MGSPIFTMSYSSSWMLHVHSQMQISNSTYDKEPFWPCFATWKLGTQTTWPTWDQAEPSAPQLGRETTYLKLWAGTLNPEMLHPQQHYPQSPLCPLLERWLGQGRTSAFLFALNTVFHSIRRNIKSLLFTELWNNIWHLEKNHNKQ